MKNILLILLIFCTTGIVANAQHYQRIVTAITSCKTSSCIDSVRQHYQPLKANSPLTKSLGLDAQRLLMDFELGHGGKKDPALAKGFRLSLFLQGNQIHYGQLEQIGHQGQLETTYLFENNVPYLKNHVATYNQLYSTSYTYQDLVRSITSREPNFWIWVH